MHCSPCKFGRTVGRTEKLSHRGAPLLKTVERVRKGLWHLKLYAICVTRILLRSGIIMQIVKQYKNWVYCTFMNVV